VYSKKYEAEADGWANAKSNMPRTIEMNRCLTDVSDIEITSKKIINVVAIAAGICPDFRSYARRIENKSESEN